MKNKGYIETEILIAILSLLLFCIILFIFIKLEYGNEHITTCQVKEKWVKSVGDNNQKYLISCGDNVYQITDLLFKGKFNSSDIYAKLEIGKTYTLTTTGYRIGFLSDYENINEVEECNVVTNNGVNFSDINAYENK